MIVVPAILFVLITTQLVVVGVPAAVGQQGAERRQLLQRLPLLTCRWREYMVATLAIWHRADLCLAATGVGLGAAQPAGVGRGTVDCHHGGRAIDAAKLARGDVAARSAFGGFTPRSTREPAGGRGAKMQQRGAASAGWQFRADAAHDKPIPSSLDRRRHRGGFDRSDYLAPPGIAGRLIWPGLFHEVAEKLGCTPAWIGFHGVCVEFKAGFPCCGHRRCNWAHLATTT